MNRSKRFVLVPFCVLSQAVQAQGIVKYEWKSSIKPILSLLMDNDINIIQMPCPESSFGGFGKSLIRPPKNIEGYDNEDYYKHCQGLCESVLDMVEAIINNGYELVAVLGIDKSPSCSNGVVHTDEGGLIERKGVFMECLNKLFDEKNISVPILGINKKDVSGVLAELKKLIEK